MKRQMVLISIIVLFLLLLSLYACDVDSVQVVEEYPLSDAEVSAYLDYAIDINALSNTKTDSLKDTILLNFHCIQYIHFHISHLDINHLN